MADQGPKKVPSIPVWQQKSSPDLPQRSADDEPSSDTTSTTSSTPELSALEQARKFLEDESIRDASRERKVAFLEKKGLSSDEIDQLLDSEHPSSSDAASDLKTVHDSTETTSNKAPESSPPRPSAPSTQIPQSTTSPRRDVPPIITYPEFLLKPAKPPPLITFSRLVNAAYAFAGLATLTYAASNYIVEPMLETLTSARHDLSSTTLSDLDQLNSKLESVVSHVPYIASTSTQRPNPYSDEKALSDMSSDSDPTELFHRDIATQTSPHPSPSLPSESTLYGSEFAPSDPTASQSTRLRSLHSTLSSLLTSTDTNFSQDKLKESVADFQTVLDKLSNTYNPFQTSYSSGSSSFTSYTPTAEDKTKTKKSSTSDNEAARFRAEIRALKGAFLSSRNFPTARPAAPFTLQRPASAR
ncbi:hypothetical protein LTR99_003769 [Exophiala xenobiotica]|uniref:Peroxisomal membrane protein PEX14 n=1 Tax=Vermiconidia calcicola TaxID=1690605 RepID=A0AAV9Q0I7_9PEZI|nr:hypothetical protein LTR99_003769 [Exophiala xenobiotica]KAK5435237.1 hypothetical protein LTR34_002740 [Exophiala xenobiotica]KAK5531462.1 hypothetical protein LTR25_008571 [Vermiconidia calcicola]KAK5544751.1 hypothetical protein LTR23_004191 [Chaetothyriales sp. CCFEE 6169]